MLRQKFTTEHDHKPRPQVKWNNDLALLSKELTDKCQGDHILFPHGGGVCEKTMSNRTTLLRPACPRFLLFGHQVGQNLATAIPGTSLVSTIDYYWSEEVRNGLIGKKLDKLMKMIYLMAIQGDFRERHNGRL
jgi:hypothetical protein